MAPRPRPRVRILPPRQRAVVILLALVSALILSLSQQPPATRRWLAVGVVAFFVLAFVAGVVAPTLSPHP